MLTAAGFKVVKKLDADRRTLEETIIAFAQGLEPSDTALFFYAGHGMQVSGESYLLPVDARAAEPAALRYEAITLDFVLDLLDREGKGAGLKILLLDSCRDNPFGRRWRGPRTGASPNAGFAAPSSSPRGTVLGFATDPGDVAADGIGRNSPYTAALKQHLFRSGTEIEQALKDAGAAVQRATNKRQNPWRNSNFNGTFVLIRFRRQSCRSTLKRIVDIGCR